jgi:hypothetical protein
LNQKELWSDGRIVHAGVRDPVLQNGGVRVGVVTGNVTERVGGQSHGMVIVTSERSTVLDPGPLKRADVLEADLLGIGMTRAIVVHATGTTTVEVHNASKYTLK